MKRIILSALIGLMAISASAQLMRSEELEKYAKEKLSVENKPKKNCMLLLTIGL